MAVISTYKQAGQEKQEKENEWMNDFWSQAGAAQFVS